MDKKNYLNLKKLAQNLGADLFGVGDTSSIKKEFILTQKIRDKFDKAVSLGIRLSRDILEEISDSPTKLYFHHYRIANSVLDQLAFRLSHYIQGKGYSALAIPASQILDWQNQKAHLSHKHVAYLAGLGWIGRNNLLVNSRLGGQLRLVTVLTDMPLKLDKPVKRDCGICVSCLKLCPAGAIKESHADFDHLGCFEKLKEFQKKRLVDQYICGICVNACRKK